jgi:RNA polymerase sigma-70 factor (ECF subfamily)
LYTLARNAAARFRRSPHRRPSRNVGLSGIDAVVDRARTATPAYLRTDARNGIAAIRDALPQDDRALLVLRIDRDMSWKDIARVFSAADDSEEAVIRECARLRKRFQIVKDEIRARAKEAGLLQESPDSDGRGLLDSAP